MYKQNVCRLFINLILASVLLSACDEQGSKVLIPTVKEINVTPSEIQLLDNETAELKVSVTPAAALRGKEISWFSSRPNVATVSPTGLVTGIAAGTTTIEVSVDGVRVLVPVTVNPSVIPAEEFILDTTASTLRVGENLTLEPRILPENSTNKTIVWESSEPSVAEVSPEGVVTAVGLGTSLITGRLTKELSVFCVVTVDIAHPAELFAKTNFDGSSFLPNNDNAIQVALPFPEPMDKLFEVDGKSYRMPTRYEWAILVPLTEFADEIGGSTSKYSGSMAYGTPDFNKSGILQDVEVNGVTLTYKEDLKGGETIRKQLDGFDLVAHQYGYGLRFQKADRSGDEYAQDNRYRAAYRYDYGVNTDGQEVDAEGYPTSVEGFYQMALHITVRPLPEDWTGTIDDVAKEAFWAENGENDIKVTLPAVSKDGPKGFNKIGDYFAPLASQSMSSSYTATIMFDTRAIYVASNRMSDKYPLRLIQVID